MAVGYYETTSPRKYRQEFIPDVNIRTRQRSEVRRTKEVSKSNVKSSRKAIAFICIFFVALFTLSCRSAIINSIFNEKENLKKQLSEINKENEQLQVSIEQQMNFNLIEQEAKERLGMQKLDNSQKVYVNIDKEDHIETPKATDNNQSWISKFFNDLFKK